MNDLTIIGNPDDAVRELLEAMDAVEQDTRNGYETWLASAQAARARLAAARARFTIGHMAAQQ